MAAARVHSLVERFVADGGSYVRGSALPRT